MDRTDRIRAARAAGEFAVARKPVRPSSTISGIPPEGNATTGRPPEKASTTTRGVESLSEEGTTRRSSWENTAPMSSCHPRNLNGQIAACALYLFEILGAGEQRRPGDNEPAVGDLRGEKPRGRHELHLSLLRLDPADDADVPGFRRVAGPPCPGRLGHAVVDDSGPFSRQVPRERLRGEAAAGNHAGAGPAQRLAGQARGDRLENAVVAVENERNRSGPGHPRGGWKQPRPVHIQKADAPPVGESGDGARHRGDAGPESSHVGETLAALRVFASAGDVIYRTFTSVEPMKQPSHSTLAPGGLAAWVVTPKSILSFSRSR